MCLIALALIIKGWMKFTYYSKLTLTNKMHKIDQSGL